MLASHPILVGNFLQTFYEHVSDFLVTTAAGHLLRLCFPFVVSFFKFHEHDTHDLLPTC